MRHFALSSEGDLRSVQWPPRWYFFDSSIYQPTSNIIPGVDRIKSTCTELRNWSPEELSSAWESYTSDMGVSGEPVPVDRDRLFTAYLYAKQELGFARRKLDDLDHLWERHWSRS